VSGTVSKFKLFFAHQDEEQEAWLRSMAQQGLHLEDVTHVIWTFRVGEPRDMVYRVDYPAASRDPAFQQLMQDAGWSLAATTVGWHYWRTEAIAGKAPEIFTDPASKAAKFKRVISMVLGSCLPMLIVFIILDKQQAYEQLSLPFRVALLAATAFALFAAGYSVLRLMQRLRRLWGPLPG